MSPCSSAGRIVVDGANQAPYAGYWIDTTRDFVQYFHKGERLPPGRWAFVTAEWELSRTQLRALIEQLGLYIGDISNLRFA